MAWIKQVPEDEAEGQLARIYKAALSRAGRVAGILKVQSINPAALQACMQLYIATTTTQDSPLTRAQREMIATVVSKTNGCHY